MLEKILKFSLTYRYFIAMLVGALAIYGLYNLRYLPIDAVPDITNNQVQINTSVSGLSPTEVEKQITFPIETALTGIPGLEGTRSLSRNGFSQVTVVFQDKVNIYFARQQITERLAEVRESLPNGADPKMGPISTGLSEVYMWTVDFDPNTALNQTQGEDSKIGWQKNDTYITPEGLVLKDEAERISYLRTVQDWIIRPQLKGIPGLAGIDAIGGYLRQYHVTPDPIKLIALGLSFNDIIEALQNNNINIGAGYIEQGGESYLVKGDGRIETSDHIGNVIISREGKHPIYIKDVAEIGIGKEMRSGSATENGHEVVIGTAMMLIGGNSRIVSEAVKVKLEEISDSLPPGISVKPVLNRSKLIDLTIHTVVSNLAEGAILVIAILFAFLGNIRAAFITASIIPLSMLLTAIGMVQSKISGNLMSLGAIDFGLIVDGAVIIAENCLRRLREQQHKLGRTLNLEERLHEVMVASKEMIQPSVFGQAIIMIVYIPLLMLSGIEGKMFEPMAITVIFALIAAFILSLTFVPAMIAICVKGPIKEKESKLLVGFKSLYQPLLEKSVKNPYAVIIPAVALLIGTYFLFQQLGQEFVPTLDEQDIAVQASRIPSTSLTQATSMQREVENTLTGFPQVAFVFSKTGTAEMASDPMPPYASDTFVILKPKNEWPDPKLSKLDLIESMEEELNLLPGNSYEFTQPIEMRFNELIAGVRSDVAVKVYGDDFDTMKKTANEIAKVLVKVPGAADVAVDKTDGLPTMEVIVNRSAISRYGLNVKSVLDVVETAVGGSKAGIILEGDRRFDLLVRLPENLRNDQIALSNLPIPLPEMEHGSGSIGHGSIPLKEVATLKTTLGLNQISRENGKRLVIVQSNVRGTDLSSFVKEAKEQIKEKVKIPAGYWIEWGGQFEHLLSAKERLLYVVPCCFALILMLLFTVFHSWKHAFLVFSGVPLALTGGVAALWLRDMSFSISAAVGFIALSGIAVLNGLVMVSTILQLAKEGYGTEESVVHGALIRLRPVLITALVASLGFLPMALSHGAGAEVQKPLATVVIGGLISSTLLTLFVLPALYMILPRKLAKI